MKIIVCQECDNGNLDSRVVDAAIRKAVAMGDELIVVSSQMLDDRFHAKEKATANQCLEVARKKIELSGVKCKTILSVRGMEPREDIVKIAEENGVEEIYIGIKKRSKLGKILIGSTTQYLILKSPYTVVAVK